MVGVIIYNLFNDVSVLLIVDDMPLARPWGRAPFPARWGSL